MKVLETAAKAKDGLLYISNRQEIVPELPVTNVYAFKAMMRFAKEHTNSRNDSETESRDETITASKINTNDQNDQQVWDVCKEDPTKLWHLHMGHATALRAVGSVFGNGRIPKSECPDNTCNECTKIK